MRGGQTNVSNFTDLNRELNIADCYKDGAEYPSVAMLPFFQKAVKGLFGDTTRAMNTIQKEIMGNLEYGDAKPEKICWLQVVTQKKLNDPRPTYDNNDIVNKLPLGVDNAFHDSGYSPTQIKHDINQILSPGSYIDPASRAKSGVQNVTVEDGDIPELDFIRFGFGGAIKSFKGEARSHGAMKDMMKITINFSDGSDIVTTRTHKHKHAGSDIDYFGGNFKKNTWISDNSNSKSDDKLNMAKKYILCKELGDTLQVLYAHKIIGNNLRIKYCIFTGDNTVLVRSRELGIPVCIQKNTNKEYSNVGISNYYINSQIEDAERVILFKTMYKTQCIERNKRTIDNIGAITESFIFGGKEITLTPIIKTLFKSIQKKIEDINEEVEGVSIEGAKPSLEAFKKYMAERTAFTLVNSGIVNSGIVNHNFTRLFPKPTGSIEGWKEGVMLGAVLQRLIPVERARVTYSRNRGETARLREERFKVRDARLKVIKANTTLKRARDEQAAEPTVKTLIEHVQTAVTEWLNTWKTWFRQPQRGGGTEEPDTEEPDITPTQDFYDITCCIFLKKIDEGYITKYYMVESTEKMAIPFTKEECAEDAAYEFLCLMYNFLNYIGDTPTDEEVLTPFIELFMKGDLQNHDLDMFKMKYSSIEIVQKAYKSLDEPDNANVYMAMKNDNANVYGVTTPKQGSVKTSPVEGSVNTIPVKGYRTTKGYRRTGVKGSRKTKQGPVKTKQGYRKSLKDATHFQLNQTVPF